MVNVSSIGHWAFTPAIGMDLDAAFAADPAGFNTWKRYGESKLANILHAKELQRRMAAEGAGVTAVALHPGNIMTTGLHRTFGFRETLSMLGFTLRAIKSAAQGGARTKTVEEGAATQTLLCVAPIAAAGEAGAASPASAIRIRPGGYYADCKEETSLVHAAVDDADLARRLWARSEEAVARVLAARAAATAATAAAAAPTTAAAAAAPTAAAAAAAPAHLA